MTWFEPLDADAAETFVEQSIEEFISERRPTGDVADVEFEAMRREVLRQVLPEGIRTSGHRFESIVSNGERVGQVWYGPLADSDTDVYICDIVVTAEHRRRGHARAAIELIMDSARRSHATRVGLTVAQENTAAVALYESLGFVTTSEDDTEREMWSSLVDRSKDS